MSATTEDTATGAPGPDGPQPERMPFDHARLDAAMEDVGVDVVLSTARHNVRYLLGGYRHHYYANEEALGLSRYQPIVGYVRGKPSEAFFVGNWMDGDPLEHHELWVGDLRPTGADGRSTAQIVVDALRTRGLDRATIGIEPPFMSVEVYRPLADALDDARFVDVVPTLEHLRAVKRPAELELMRGASERIVAAMQAVFDRARAGVASREIDEWMAEEQRRRGLEFGFSFVGLGARTNRTPSSDRLAAGMTVNIDSAGKLDGYIGDLARMGVVGEPSAGQQRALETVDAIQMAAREPIRRGATGAAIYAAAEQAVRDSGFADRIDFVAHGIGMVSHEAPRIAPVRTNPHRYPASHADQPLEAGMVLSIETTLVDPDLGYVKLEDTVAVTATGAEGLGDGGRGWNLIDDTTGVR